MIAREEARLRALFERLLLLSIATSPLACSTPESPTEEVPDTGASPAPPPHGDAGGAAIDATSANDAATNLDADGSPTPNPYGFSDAACNPVFLDGEADGSGCDFLETLPCGLPPGTLTDPTAPCYVALASCAALCNEVESLQHVCAISECLNEDASSFPSNSPLTLECATGAGACAPGAGRRPEGLVACAPARHGDPIGSVLADMARLEAASVHAFGRLGAELASRRAPRSLVRAAERSAREEVRHARVMSRLARRHGAVPAPVSLSRRQRGRSLEVFAIENAVEGCVRECFGALVATYQASHAPDPELAREMGRIARDETRHAALAREIARWVEPRLSPASRARIRRAMCQALATLRCEVESTPAALARPLGLPSGRDGARLVDAFGAALFG
ncbi:MAG: ferritin-like domain-containing protein [Polyangiaceae bacterium]